MGRMAHLHEREDLGLGWIDGADRAIGIGLQPAAAAGGLQRVPREPAAGRGARARGRRVGSRGVRSARRAFRPRRDAAVGRPRERASTRPAGERRGRVPSRLARADADRGRGRPDWVRLGWQAGRARRARRHVHDARPGRSGRRLSAVEDARARPSGDGEATLHGEKWFCSAPMSDAFLVLAQAPGGLSCYLVPRVLPDGERNGFHIQRLKPKLGNRSNASAEIELDGAWAQLVGEEGRGVQTIIEMVNQTRLDCVLGSAALMRRAVAEAMHHAAHRSAVGRLLIEQPLMQNVLADLCIESEAATLTAMRLARACDDGETAFLRLATAVAKYWVCKLAPAVTAEALECLGGNGYVEESGMPRLYRESPLNSIWEGAGNVNCLDVLRAIRKTPETLTAFFDEVEPAAGANPRLDSAIAAAKAELNDPADAEVRARRLVERLALVLQGSLLVRHGDPAVADAFLARAGSRAYGTLPPGVDFLAIIDRHRPQT